MLLDRRGRRDGDDRLQRAAALDHGRGRPRAGQPRHPYRYIGAATLDAADFAPEIPRTIEHTGETA
ncbi:hypothetical protein ACFYN5_35400 [Streptomyces sp. NPDC007126]|uniref:hypothetical protein n=1 Tax=Streptomyces sp. NPDC007126 TaxID=3364774 RepID=UPI0036B9D0E4